jgi:hypothetical protein
MEKVQKNSVKSVLPFRFCDLEVSNETTAAARQQPARQWTGCLAITWESQRTTRNNRRTVFSVGPCRRVISETKFRA